MGRQVEGWWRTALCVVLHPIIQIRVWTSDSAPSPPPPPPLPCCRTRFVSFRYPSTAADAICHCRALLKTPFKKKKKKRVEGLPLWFWVIYEVPLSAYSAVVFTVFCQRNIKVSEVVRANHSGQKCLSLATECFISLQLKPSLCVIKAEEIQLWEIKDPQMRGGEKNASRTHTLTSLLCTKQFLIYAQ